MKNKFLKILGIISLGFMFFVSTAVPVSAESKAVDYHGVNVSKALPTSEDWSRYNLKASDYPYFAVGIGSIIENVPSPNLQVRIIYSSQPIILNADGSLGPSSGGLKVSFSTTYWWNSNKYGVANKSDFVEVSKGSFYTANHTIKNIDGSIFFLAPLLTAELVKPLVEETTQNSQVVITGLMICLAVLVICLAVLPTVFRRYSNS